MAAVAPVAVVEEVGAVLGVALAVLVLVDQLGVPAACAPITLLAAGGRQRLDSAVDALGWAVAGWPAGCAAGCCGWVTGAGCCWCCCWSSYRLDVTYVDPHASFFDQQLYHSVVERA